MENGSVDNPQGANVFFECLGGSWILKNPENAVCKQKSDTKCIPFLPGLGVCAYVQRLGSNTIENSCANQKIVLNAGDRMVLSCAPLESGAASDNLWQLTVAWKQNFRNRYNIPHGLDDGKPTKVVRCNDEGVLKYESVEVQVGASHAFSFSAALSGSRKINLDNFPRNENKRWLTPQPYFMCLPKCTEETAGSLQAALRNRYSFGPGVKINEGFSVASQYFNPRNWDWRIYFVNNGNAVTCENPEHLPNQNIAPFCRGRFNLGYLKRGNAFKGSDARLPLALPGQRLYWRQPHPRWGFRNTNPGHYVRYVRGVTCTKPYAENGVFVPNKRDVYQCGIDHPRVDKTWNVIRYWVQKIGLDKVDVRCVDISGNKVNWPRADNDLQNTYVLAGTSCEIVCKNPVPGFDEEQEKLLVTCSYKYGSFKGLFYEPLGLYQNLAYLDQQASLDTYWGACRAN